MAKGMMGFGYQRMRKEKEKKFPTLCRDYNPRSSLGNCEMADSCKNATYRVAGQNWAVCYGGTKSSERENRRNLLRKQHAGMISGAGKVNGGEGK